MDCPPEPSPVASPHDPARPSLIASCIDVYLQRLQFDIPVLDAQELRRERSEPWKLFPPGSLLSCALVASSVPWLSLSSLQQWGFPSRHAALDEAVQSFERARRNTTADSTALLQSLLLILRATTTKDAQPSRLTILWLKAARKALSSMSSHIRDHRFRPLFKRLWWACAEAEHMFFLTSILENNGSTPTQTTVSHLLNCSNAELPSLRDLNGSESVSPILQRQQHFSRWAAYRQRMALWRHLSALLHARPAAAEQKLRRNQLHHNLLFWGLQELTERFEGWFDERRGGLDLGHERDHVALAMRCENVLIYGRIMLSYFTPSSKQETDRRSAEDMMWQGLETGRALSSAAWVGKAGDGALAGDALPSLTGRMLRGLITSIRVVRGISSQQTQPLLGQLAKLLEECVQTHERFWTAADDSMPGTTTASPLTCSTGLEEEDEDDELLTPGPVECCMKVEPQEAAVLCMSYDGSEDPMEEEGEAGGDAHLKAQEALMKDFDNMWNVIS